MKLTVTYFFAHDDPKTETYGHGTTSGDWAKARRRVMDAMDSDPEVSHAVLESGSRLETAYNPHYGYDRD